MIRRQYKCAYCEHARVNSNGDWYCTLKTCIKKELAL